VKQNDWGETKAPPPMMAPKPKAAPAAEEAPAAEGEAPAAE
jgi:hypothetical protein